MGDRTSRENQAGRVSPPCERVDGGDLVSSSTGLVKRRAAPKRPSRRALTLAPMFEVRQGSLDRPFTSSRALIASRHSLRGAAFLPDGKILPRERHGRHGLRFFHRDGAALRDKDQGVKIERRDAAISTPDQVVPPALTVASTVEATPPFLTCLQPCGTVRFTLSFVNVSTRIVSDQKESDDALCQSWPT